MKREEHVGVIFSDSSLGNPKVEKAYNYCLRNFADAMDMADGQDVFVLPLKDAKMIAKNYQVWDDILICDVDDDLVPQINEIWKDNDFLFVD